MISEDRHGKELSIPELLHRFSEQSTTLIRQELALAQAEFTRKIIFFGEGAGLFGAAAFFVLAAGAT
jgi:hypothetical protein